MLKRSLFFLMAALLCSACGEKAQLIRENPVGPTFQSRQLSVYLESSLNTALAEGPMALKLAAPVTLSDATELPMNAIVHGYFVTRGNEVLFAPSFAMFNDGTQDKRLAINSNQTGRVAVTPTTARYMKEAGKGAAIGAGVGALGGALIGADHGIGGALLGAAIGAGIGAATGAASSATGVWLRGDEPVTLPAGSGLIIHLE